MEVCVLPTCWNTLMNLQVVITQKTVVRAIPTVKAEKLLRESVSLLIYN
jgi:hypothetical protein